MSLADSLKTALESFSRAQAKVMEAYGGHPPTELSQHFQMMQDKLTGGMEQVQQLSDKMEEAKAKHAAEAQALAAGREETKEDGIDFEAYPWQFEKEHGLGAEPCRELVQSLLGGDAEPKKPPAPEKPPTLPKLQAPPLDLSEPFSSPTDIAPNWDTLDLPD
jgi:hypothetical protein